MSISRTLHHLYSLHASSPDFSRHLYCLIRCDEDEQYSSSLQGLELAQLVDFLDEALSTIPTTDNLSQECLHKLQAICSHHMILPSSYDISDEIARVGDHPIALDAIADTWEGTYGSKRASIKCLRVSMKNCQTLQKSFFREAVVWKRLKHPNVVPFIGITRDPLQIVSEWMPNGTLAEYLERNPGANRISLLFDIAEGLNYLHANRTTHGDLKGPNILIDHDGHACLTGFEFTSVVRGINSAPVTQANGYTAAWAAPEILEGADKSTQEADVFSFGMVVIEVFTGRCPFSELTTPVIISKVMAGERPARPQEAQEIDPTDLIWDMTVHCWHQDPAQRPTMEEPIGVLRECYYRLCGASLTPPDGWWASTMFSSTSQHFGQPSSQTLGMSVDLSSTIRPGPSREPPDLSLVAGGPIHYPDLILPRLYLCDLHTAQDPAVATSIGITHILSILDFRPTFPREMDHIKRMHVNLSDKFREKITPHLDNTTAFIREALERDPDNKVLVHGVMGISRSATVVCAYLIVEKGMTGPAAIDFVRGRRPTIRPGLRFRRELDEYAANVRGGFKMWMRWVLGKKETNSTIA